ncbi:MAG TPA: energy transducer TonB [Pyrinomonadaceae bacterium]|nr:energy transducer TonB [Pyrinomonadaceae bacterium]
MVLNNKAQKKPSPVYPAAAIAERVSGQVSVLVIYDETGHVISATAFGDKLLKEAAEKAAYQAVFPPTSVNGKRVKVRGYLTYEFDLHEK